ncbi:MAG: sulfotransferase [Candidatus Heimdallarchaeota archaeon]
MPFRLIERMKYNRKIRETDIEQDPIFIIGHWRTRTTLLHSMLTKDENFGYITNLETYCPHFFLSFEKLTRRIIDFALPKTRPMDNVKLSSFETAEEEFAIGSYDKYSFYHHFIFPRNFELYSKYLFFDECTQEEIQRWKTRYQFFLKKITLKHNGKRLVLKNPANTPRVKYLLEMFPDAKFIHTYRNPYFVFSSTLKLFRNLLPVFSLQKWDDKQIQDGFLRNFKKMYEIFERDKKLIPKGNLLDVKYEDLIIDPLKASKQTYKELLSDNYELPKEKFEQYTKQQSSFVPNQYVLSDDIITKVNDYWDQMRRDYGYERMEVEPS